MNQLIKNFNNFIKKTIFIVQNKTNNKLLLFKVKKKTNNKLLISKFNKYLITLISLLFFYLFYLSIPVLYDKNWVQENLENQLLKDFKIYFSLSSDISYRILPSPHYLIKDSKILKETDKTVSLAEIKTLKVFISQKSFLDKKKLLVLHMKISNADFTLPLNDLKFLKNSTKNKFSKKNIKIDKSKIFFKNSLDETVAVIKISKAFLFQDSKNLLNLFKLNGEIFNFPFKFNYSKKFDSLKKEEFEFVAKTLKLNIFNTYIFSKNNINKGKNIISFSNSKINTDYKIENNILILNSSSSRIKNSKVSYNGKMTINPSNLNLNIDLGNYDISKMLNNNSVLNELLKTELLFNDNISMTTSLKTSSNLKNKIFQNAKIYFNIINGKLNFNKTRLVNDKIGLLEIENSNLSFETDRLILNTDVIVTIKNSGELFSLLQTNKKFRKPISSILINLDYDFLSKEIDFNNVKIDNQEIDDESLRIIDGFNDKELNNWNKGKRLLNIFFEIYEG